MDLLANEWLHIAVRWVHLFAGILWIGQTWYFTWLERRFGEAAGQRDGAGRVWMVHSGGFYVVEKQERPVMLPEKLHWFRWEAAVTFLSGLLLLLQVYYAGALLVDFYTPSMSSGIAMTVGLGSLAISWFAYDAVWRSPIGRNERLGAAVSLALLAALSVALWKLFLGRAAYMHVGAALGTIMTANVWLCIIPSQRKMVASMARKEVPDHALAARAKGRSKHNTFMVMPLLFLMLSNHFPTTSYGSEQGLLVLLLLMLLGFAAAGIVRRR